MPHRPKVSVVAAVGLVVIGSACSELTAPSSRSQRGAAKAEPAAAPKPQPTATATAVATAPKPPSDERVGAAHVLVAYKGALRANPKVTRSKEEAKKLADDVAAKAKKGEDFAELAKKYSDGPSGPKGGALGAPFNRRQMVKPFSDAAFDLQVNQVSGVVETKFGFHVIKRTQ